MIAPPAPRRPAPGGGLAVLVVVTILAALAAPHAKAFRGLVAGGLPAITVPRRPAPPPATRPPSGLSFTNAAGCRPAGDYRSPRLDRRVRTLLVAAADRHPIRVSCLRTGHSWYVKGTRRVSNHSVWRAVDLDRVDGRPVSPPTPRPAGWPSGSAAAGPGCSRARSARPGASGAGPGSATPATRGTCMSASVARPSQVGPDDRPGPAAGAGAARHRHPGLPARPGRDRLRRRPGPGPARGARPGGAGPQKPAAGQPRPSRPRSPTFPPATCGCTAQAGARYRIPWPVLAAIGKVESDHGRVRLPGVRSGSNWAGACGPMQIGCVPRQQGRQQLGPLRPRPPPRPGPGDPGRRPLPGRPRRPPQPGPGHLRLQPLPGLRGQGQAARPPLRPRGGGRR